MKIINQYIMLTLMAMVSSQSMLSQAGMQSDLQSVLNSGFDEITGGHQKKEAVTKLTLALQALEEEKADLEAQQASCLSSIEDYETQIKAQVQKSQSTNQRIKRLARMRIARLVDQVATAESSLIEYDELLKEIESEIETISDQLSHYSGDTLHKIQGIISKKAQVDLGSVAGILENREAMLQKASGLVGSLSGIATQVGQEQVQDGLQGAFDFVRGTRRSVRVKNRDQPKRIARTVVSQGLKIGSQITSQIDIKKGVKSAARIAKQSAFSLFSGFRF